MDKAYNVSSCARKGASYKCVSNNILRFVPPLIVTKKDISVAVDILDETFQEVY